VSVGQEVFLATPHWQDATIRRLEIVGEATKRLSDELRDKQPQVPWRRIAGLQDVLIHDYLGVDLAAGWEITQRTLPDLKVQVQAILQDLPDTDES
jgi:uncharacterized protein with HEPN domain